MGTVGTVTLGILVSGDPATLGRLISISLIVTGTLSLKMALERLGFSTCYHMLEYRQCKFCLSRKTNLCTAGRST